MDNKILAYQKQLWKTHFLLSSPTFTGCPPDDKAREIAFAGRSNAGKSSTLNALTRQRQLARASKTPGRTQMINFFGFGYQDLARLVDLPGYGYAAVPLATKVKWQKELELYLTHRKALVGLVLLMDIRHPLQDYDQQMIAWANQGNLPIHILLTKADKLGYGAQKNTLTKVKNTLDSAQVRASVQLFSATKPLGLEQLSEVIGDWLGLPSVIKSDSYFDAHGFFDLTLNNDAHDEPSHD